MNTAAEYNFEWDPEKNARNRKKHGVGFEQAATVFKDPRAISLYDAEHSKQEDGWVTLGLSAGRGRLVVCHIFEWIGPSTMKKEYDFSKGTRGKFYRPKTRLSIPVYLNPDVQRFVEQIARNQRSDVSRVVNQLLKSDMKLAKVMQ